MMKVDSWDEFSPLESVYVGCWFDKEFFEDIRNPKIRDVLFKIADETKEDIEYFKRQLNSHGIEVLQSNPRELGYHDSILDYVDMYGNIAYGTGNDNKINKNLIPHSPLEPRDNIVVMGNKIVNTFGEPHIRAHMNFFKERIGKEYVDERILNTNFFFRRGDTLDKKLGIENKYSLGGFCSPNITRVGKDCLVDIDQTPDITPYLQHHYPEFRYKEISLSGHNDSIFCIVNPKLVLASVYLKEQRQDHIFKDTEVVYFDEPNWVNVKNFKRLRLKNLGKWWVPDEEDNDDFTNFVEQYLQKFVGQVDETVFDVNTLVLNDRYVVANCYSKDLFDALKRHKIEPIVCPLRHRFFFDGGWHCLTLDLKRTGGQIDYNF
jgi:hypothetical protein